MVKTFVVILQSGNTLLLALETLARVDNVAAEELLPERKASVRTYRQTDIR